VVLFLAKQSATDITLFVTVDPATHVRGVITAERCAPQFHMPPPVSRWVSNRTALCLGHDVARFMAHPQPPLCPSLVQTLGPEFRL
jgi:hypothetical protein